MLPWSATSQQQSQSARANGAKYNKPCNINGIGA
jgi:hypothetical protein